MTSPENPSLPFVVRQSQWAWLWSLFPWVIFLGLAVQFDFITLGAFPLIIAVWAVGQSYLTWRKTRYILDSQEITIHIGWLFGSRKIPLSLADIQDVHASQGFWGRTLGYETVTIVLAGQRGSARMAYIPLVLEFQKRIEEAVKASGGEAKPDINPVQ